ncbi:hypothetical protein E3N88_25841 [Mikania micrantha]|uniref:Uncharacterized protein n=1 Tax=Mikania micrantha TaxID=192012 RepID=A0A5N6N6T4_9ASTR|nr:hypothetical protein E3N88_25841 [Mikania micrantha]
MAASWWLGLGLLGARFGVDLDWFRYFLGWCLVNSLEACCCCPFLAFGSSSLAASLLLVVVFIRQHLQGAKEEMKKQLQFAIMRDIDNCVNAKDIKLPTFCPNLFIIVKSVISKIRCLPLSDSWLSSSFRSNEPIEFDTDYGNGI